MQSFLYILEEANAHKINNKLPLALKKYMAAIKVINDFEDDQYDFHGYNLRKFTVNIYLKYVFYISLLFFFLPFQLSWIVC